MSDFPIKLLTRICPVCNSTQGYVLHTQDFQLVAGNPLPSSYDVVSCTICGFVFADSSATQEDYDRYYEHMSKYESLVTASGSNVTSYDKERLEETALTIARFFPDKGSAIVDVGCANGGLLADMKRLGYTNISGLDPSASCVAMVKALGFPCVHGSMYAEHSFEQAYDGIVLTHVLEHVYDVKKALAVMMRALRVGGRIYIEVPDASRYKDFSIMPFYFFDVEHINHFDETAFRNLFATYDGTIVEVGKKDMPVSHTNTYPAMYVVFEKASDALNASQPFVLGVDAKESVVHHIRESSRAAKHPALEKLVADREPLIVWGAGQATQRWLKNTALGSANILFFVDNDEKKHGFTMNNLRIVSPQDIGDTRGTICICSALHAEEIREQIQLMGLSNPVVVL